MTDDAFERPNYAGQEVLSLYRGLIRVPLIAPRSMRQIARQVAETHGLSLENLLSQSRRPTIALPRQEAMAAIRDQTRYSLTQIGEFFGKDHTTVLYGLRAHEARKAGARLDRADGLKARAA